MQKHRGFSLIEMMLVVAMALLISTSFLQLLVSNNQATHFHENLSASQENGRHSLYLLSRTARMGGYRGRINLGTLIPLYQGACNGTTPCTFDGGGTTSDQVAIQYEPVPVGTTGNGVDCAGNTVRIPELTADVYFVANDPANNNVSTLFCQGFNPATAVARGSRQALVQGVENLQIVYGVSSIGTEVVDQYQPASAVTNWANVRNIRFGLLVNSGITGPGFETRTRTFNILESGTLSFTDNTPRYVYTTVATIVNAGL